MGYAQSVVYTQIHNLTDEKYWYVGTEEGLAKVHIYCYSSEEEAKKSLQKKDGPRVLFNADKCIEKKGNILAYNTIIDAFEDWFQYEREKGTKEYVYNKKERLQQEKEGKIQQQERVK